MVGYAEAFERSSASEQDYNPRRFEQVVGNSAVLESVFAQVELVAPTDSTVSDPGRNRHGQGTDCTGDSQYQPSLRTPIHTN